MSLRLIACSLEFRVNLWCIKRYGVGSLDCVSLTFSLDILGVDWFNESCLLTKLAMEHRQDHWNCYMSYLFGNGISLTKRHCMSCAYSWRPVTCVNGIKQTYCRVPCSLMIGVGMPTHLAPRLYVKWSKQISVLYCSLQLSLWMLSKASTIQPICLYLLGVMRRLRIHTTSIFFMY